MLSLFAAERDLASGTRNSAHARRVRQDARVGRVRWSKESLDELQMGQKPGVSPPPLYGRPNVLRQTQTVSIAESKLGVVRG